MPRPCPKAVSSAGSGDLGPGRDGRSCPLGPEAKPGLMTHTVHPTEAASPTGCSWGPCVLHTHGICDSSWGSEGTRLPAGSDYPCAPRAALPLVAARVMSCHFACICMPVPGDSSVSPQPRRSHPRSTRWGPTSCLRVPVHRQDSRLWAHPVPHVTHVHGL